jgi:Kelch motif
MKRSLSAMAFLACVALCGTLARSEQEREKEKFRPLAGLPSKPGSHVEKIKALRDNEWLNLGAPAADPNWGKARGRSWCAPMQYASELGGSFLYGEGVHGYSKPDGRYMDDLWFYDALAHRWVCVYPGYDTRDPPELSINAAGFEATKGGEPIPIAAPGHGYGMSTYDPDAHRFASFPASADYWGRAMPKRKEFLKDNGKKLNTTHASPWFYDTATAKWERMKTLTPGPTPGFGGLLVYLPTKKQFWCFNKGASLYDPATNKWTASAVKERQPTGIDFGSCFDSKRDRIYVCGGSYRGPYAKDEGKVYIYDVKSDSWSNPPDKGSVPPVLATNSACVHYDTAADRVLCLVYRATTTGVFAFDPSTGAWAEKFVPFPAEGPNRSLCWNGFYSPELNAHFFHVAGGSRDDGTIWVYRYKYIPDSK